MKTKQPFLILILSFLFLQNIQSQSIMFKLGGLPIPDFGYILDGGMEFRLNPHWSTQLSISTTQGGGSRGIDKMIVTPQLRYYFKKDSFQKSPYFGVVLQRHKAFLDEELVSENRQTIGWQAESFTKYGIGLMLGANKKIFKRLGFDIHVGGLLEMGDVTTDKHYWDVFGRVSPPNTSILEKNKLTVRPFFGFNLYWAEYFNNEKNY